MDKKISDTFYILKGIAIVLVVCCHSVQQSQIIPKFQISILNSLSNLGVVIFFIISGYLFKNRNIKEFLKLRIHSILIPWIIYGSIVYLYVYIRKISFISLQSYFNWIIGNGTYLYYLTIYMLLHIVFFFINSNSKMKKLLYVFSIFSLILTTQNILKINPYLNIFNWYSYFYLGYILNKKNVLKLFNKKYIYISMLIIMIAFFYGCYFTFTYWDLAFVLSAPICAAALIHIVYVMYDKKFNFILKLGKISFFIYLNHMLFTGLIKTFFVNFLPNIYIFVPFFIIIFCILEYLIVKKFLLMVNLQNYLIDFAIQRNEDVYE